jgi:hypothetical protein
MSPALYLKQKVGKQLVTGFCEHTFRVELHSLQMGIVAMA